MSYTRGETYIWSDGEKLHIWSESGLDDWQTNERFGEIENASGVCISESIADEFAVMRFAELLHSGAVADAVKRALQKWNGNFGCAALEELEESLVHLGKQLTPKP